AIYPDIIPPTLPDEAESFTLEIPVGLDRPFQVCVIGHDPGLDGDRTLETPRISRLPPICIKLSLPSEYPVDDPPKIHSLRTIHDWLSPDDLKFLSQELEKIWTGDSVLAMWIAYLSNGEEWLTSLGLIGTETIEICGPEPDAVIPLILAYNSSLGSTFDPRMHDCPICLGCFRDSHCVTLSPCGHIFCKNCLEMTWSYYIRQGEITRVRCPHDECARLEYFEPASSDVVKLMVSPDMFERWRKLITLREMELDPSIVMCPLPECQLPVRHLLHAETPELDRLRTCTCGYTFCVDCKRYWHGPRIIC
ncbi:hypothetical protein BU17DRAFT_23781, partial [Hysterangium stoloniferum]